MKRLPLLIRFATTLCTVIVLAFLFLAIVLSGCNREEWHAPMSVVNDTVPLMPALPAGKWKFTGPVTFTVQKGNNNNATLTATGKTKADAVAIGPAASAVATKAPLPWWVFVLVGAFSIGAWEYVSHRGLLSWLPWRSSTG